ncbi:ankyrin repeat-containing domain protein [Penicillium herquei]|nr:ankyrin repeat-containing domain protein [Penicillium herquei]
MCMMSLSTLSPELLLFIIATISEQDLCHLVQVNRFLYEVLLPDLYRRHIKNSEKNQVGLFRAAASGNEQGTLNFLRYGANVNAFIRAYSLEEIKPWCAFSTPINIAAGVGNDTIVQMLRDHGAEIDGVQCRVPGSWFSGGQNGFTQPPILDALLSGHESTARLLLEMGSKIQGLRMYQGGLVNPAVKIGNIAMMKLLAEFGADFNSPPCQAIPLSQVADSRKTSPDTIQFLFDHGADITLVDDGTGSFLKAVIKRGNIATARLLLEHGATCPPDILKSVIASSTLDTIGLLVDYGARLDTVLFQEAIKARRTDVIQLLIDNGLDVNAILDSKGSTALHFAVRIAQQLHKSSLRRRPERYTGCMDCGEDLFDEEAKVLVRQIDTTSKLNISPPCYLPKRKREGNSEIDLLRSLIDAGADLSAVDGEGRTPLDLACMGPPLILQQLLVDNGANLEGGELSDNPIPDKVEPHHGSPS